MAAITSAVLAATAVAGLGMSAYGMSQQMKGQEKAAQGAAIQAQGAQIQAQGSLVQSQGAQRQVEGAAAQNAATKAITGLEFDVEAQRQQAMELDARRQSMEVIRTQQRAQAMGLTNATSQGASRGSGVQGGYAQASGQANVNLLGIGQNLAIGRAIFGLDAGISQQRLAYAAGGDIINEGQGIINRGSGIIAQGAGVIAQGGGVVSQGQGQASFGQGLSSLGGSLMQAAPTLGNVASFGAQYFGSPVQGNSTYGGWMSNSGYRGIY